MHPPLYKPHPLCKKEVEDLVKCHEENPWMKFLDACGPAKRTLDACFREEKKLRVKLNKKLPDPPEEMTHSGPAAPTSDSK
jgi:Cytochrome c oxidase biogenesis protein Cmc1 like